MSSTAYEREHYTSIVNKIESLDRLSLEIQAKADTLSGPAFVSWLSHSGDPQLNQVLYDAKGILSDLVREKIQVLRDYYKVQLGSEGQLPPPKSFEKEFTIPVKEWVLEHRFGFQYPRLIMVSLDGSTLHGEPDWLNATQHTLVVKFEVPQSGRAILTL